MAELGIMDPSENRPLLSDRRITLLVNRFFERPGHYVALAQKVRGLGMLPILYWTVGPDNVDESLVDPVMERSKEIKEFFDFQYGALALAESAVWGWYQNVHSDMWPVISNPWPVNASQLGFLLAFYGPGTDMVYGFRHLIVGLYQLKIAESLARCWGVLREPAGQDGGEPQ